jgi:hypothetical protein
MMAELASCRVANDGKVGRAGRVRRVGGAGRVGRAGKVGGDGRDVVVASLGPSAA